MSGIITRTPDARRKDADRIAARRASMTPEERAAARREHDRVYREKHRAERQARDTEYRKRVAAAKWDQASS